MHMAAARSNFKLQMQFLHEVLLRLKDSRYENSIKNGTLNKATNKNNDKYLIKQSSGQTLV